jgi:pimeloyl-ACP methyl ester carboxylesterase
MDTGFFGAGKIMETESWIDAGRGRLYVKQWRDPSGRPGKAPIVLLHDSLGGVALWRDFPANLSRATGRHVVAYDRLGFGQSDPHPGKLEVGFVREEASGDFAAVRSRLGIGSFIVLGHSVGGGMAVSIAAAWPRDCVGLITVAAQAFVEDRTLDGIRLAGRNFAQPDQFERLQKYHGAKAQWVLEAWTGTWLSPEFANWTVDEELKRVRCPLLVLHGAEDEYGGLCHPERIASLTPGLSTVEILADCGHVPHREKEELVLDAVKSFIDQRISGK